MAGNLQLRVAKTNPAAVVPARATERSAGFDLSSIEAAIIPPGSRKLISTGLIVSVPEGTYGRIAPRSGLALRSGIHVGAGVVDADYTGIVHVLLFNLDASEPFYVNVGDRVAQLVLERIAGADQMQAELVSKDAIVELVSKGAGDAGDARDARGAGGFGSTGI